MAIHRYLRLSFWPRAIAFRLGRVWGRIIVPLLSIIIRVLPTRARFELRQRTAQTCRLEYPLADLQIVADSWIEGEFRSQEASKEPGTVDWIEKWIEAGDVFYDIGANIGSYSLITFGHLKGQVKIYAFESGFLTFTQLCKNFQLNSASPAIFPMQVALSESTMLASFHYQNLETGGAHHALGEPLDYKG